MINFEPIERLIEAARAVLANDPQSLEELREALEELETADSDAEGSNEAIESARDEFVGASDEDIEIDEHPLVDLVPEGIWVNAWLFVPDPAFRD
jgi:signal transduction histidine kinase